MRKKKVFYIVDIIWIISSFALLIREDMMDSGRGLAALDKLGRCLMYLCMGIIGIGVLLIPPIIELIKSSFSGGKDKKWKKRKEFKN